MLAETASSRQRNSKERAAVPNVNSSMKSSIKVSGGQSLKSSSGAVSGATGSSSKPSVIAGGEEDGGKAGLNGSVRIVSYKDSMREEIKNLSPISKQQKKIEMEAEIARIEAMLAAQTTAAADSKAKAKASAAQSADSESMVSSSVVTPAGGSGTGGGEAGVLVNQAEVAHEKAASMMSSLKMSALKPTADVSMHRSTAIPSAALAAAGTRGVTIAPQSKAVNKNRASKDGSTMAVLTGSGGISGGFKSDALNASAARSDAMMASAKSQTSSVQ